MPEARVQPSLNDHPDVRQIFGRFRTTEVTTTYTVNAKMAAGEERRGELIIGNEE